MIKVLFLAVLLVPIFGIAFAQTDVKKRCNFKAKMGEKKALTNRILKM
jgi:hypothetical protein